MALSPPFVPPRQHGLRFVPKARAARLAMHPKWQVVDFLWRPEEAGSSLPLSLSFPPAFFTLFAADVLNPRMKVLLRGEWRDNAWRARYLAARGYRVWLER